MRKTTFLDTNILLYLLSSDVDKANKVEHILEEGGIISVQVLNEITNVARKKLAMPWDDINEVATVIQTVCQTEPLTLETHEQGKRISKRYGFSIYDSMIIASAQLANCTTLYSEDMQHGMEVEEDLRIENPFV